MDTASTTKTLDSQRSDISLNESTLVSPAEPRPPAKRQKRSIEDDLLCPITLELPFEPVTAEDGRVYERAAMEEYIERKRQAGEALVSPLTKEKMGARLLAAIQTKNIIEVSIDNGTISPDLAAKWKERAKHKKYMNDLVDKAKAGNGESMRIIGFNYRYGKYGLTQNYTTAFQWMIKAHKAGSIRGTAALGEMLVKGFGCPPNQRKGGMYLTLAAGKGSSYAAYWLGMALAEGKHGMEMDKEEGIHWLKEALSGKCPVSNLSDKGAEKAKRKLQELTTVQESTTTITTTTVAVYDIE